MWQLETQLLKARWWCLSAKNQVSNSQNSRNSVSLSDVLYVYIPFAKPNVTLLKSNSEVQRKCNDVVIKFMDEGEVVLEAAYTLFYKQIWGYVKSTMSDRAFY